MTRQHTAPFPLAKARLLPLALLLAVCLCPAASADKAPPVRKTAVIPFEPLRNQGVPLVRVRLNDQVTGTFMIDTGASDCIMTDDMAKRLHLKTQPAYIHGFIPFSFGDDQDEFATVKHLQIGALLLTDAAFIVVKSDHFFTFHEQHVDGMIGTTLLSRFSLLVDFPHHAIELISPGGLSDAEVQKMGMSTAAAVPIKQDRILGGQSVFKDIDINSYGLDINCVNGTNKGKDRLYVDTGAPTTSISEDLAERLHLTAEDKQGESTMFAGSVFGNLARVPSLQVGSLTLHYPMVSYPGTKDSEIPPLLGEDILGYCTVLFDFPRKMLYLQPVLPPIATDAAAAAAAVVDLARLHQDAQTFSYAPASLATTTPEDSDDVPAHIALLQSQLKGDGTDATLYTQIGDAYEEDNQDGPAQTAYAKVVDLRRALVKAKPGDIAATAQLAEALADAGQADEAETLARKAVAQDGGNARAWVALGRVLSTRSLLVLTGRSTPPNVSDNYIDYEALVAKLRAAPPPAAQQEQARTLSHEARACFDKAETLAPEDRQTYEARADFLETDGLGISAVLHELHGDHVDLLHEPHPDAYFTDKDQIAHLSPDDPAALSEAALDDATAPYVRPENDTDYRENNIWKYLSARTRRTVQQKLDRLTVLSKGTVPGPAAEATASLGELQYEMLGDKTLAEATLRRALTLVPGQAHAIRVLTELLSDQLRYDDLTALLTSQLKQTDTALLHLLLARTLERQGNWADAETQAQRAAAMKPDSYAANITLAMLLLRRSDTSTEALSQAQVCLGKAQAALGTKPDRARASEFSIALSLLTEFGGDPASARQIILEVLTDDPANTQARDILAALFV